MLNGEAVETTRKMEVWLLLASFARFAQKLCAPDSLPIVGWLFILANWRTIKLGRQPLMG